MNMSDLIKRTQKAKALAGDPSLPKWQRLSQGLQALSGLELSAIPDDARENFEADLAGVDRVLSRYPLDTEADYQSIVDADLQTMLNMLDTATARVIAAELDRIVANFAAAKSRLPVDAIKEAREHRSRCPANCRLTCSATR
jgi:hypothetical protein